MAEDPIYTFLRKRGLKEDVIQEMKNEKIDVDVVTKLGSNSDELAKFLCIGDRLALRDFCQKEKALHKESARQQRKRKCYASIRKKMRLNTNDSFEDSDEHSEDEIKTSSKASKLIGNQNASKSTRTIEFGWYHNGTNVRRPNGGGTRKTTIAKSSTHEDLLNEAKNLFFPKGVCRKSVKVEECTFTVRDFTQEELPPNITVGDFCDMVKMSGKLRFFLYSTGPPLRKVTDCKLDTQDTFARPEVSHTVVRPATTSTPTQNQICTASTPTQSQVYVLQGPIEHEVSPIQISPCNFKQPVNTSAPRANEIQSECPVFESLPDLDEPWVQQEIVIDGSCSAPTNDDEVTFGPDPMCSNVNLSDTLPLTFDEQKISVQDTERDPTPFSSNRSSPEPRSPTPPPSSIQPINQFSSEQDPQVSVAAFVQQLQPGPLSPVVAKGVQGEIRVRRVMLQHDIITRFMDPNILDTPLTFTFVNERGVDVYGVSRDAYTCFWDQFLSSSAKGEEERVPAIMPHLQFGEWEAVGRILVKGFFDHGVFPIQISRAFLVAMLFGEHEVSTDLLMESFLLYVTEPERVVIKKALDSNLVDEDDQEDFEDLLARMDCHTVPTGDHVKVVLNQIAQAELIQQSKYALDAMATIVRGALLPNLPNPKSLLDLYESKQPSCRKVLKLLQASPADVEENRVFGYVKQLIRGFAPDILVNFLHFVTGARVICVEKISISFNKARGLARAPIARTCTPMLELSSTYSSFPEFRHEFLNVLAGHSGKFDID